MSYRPTRLTIDLDAISHNLKTVRQCTNLSDPHQPPVAVCAVLKSNAYGMGAVAIAKHLNKLGVEWMAVALLEEAIALRNTGITTPLLLFSAGLYNASIKLLREYQITPVLGQLRELKRLEQEACYEDNLTSFPVHIAIDTGMGRMGFSPSELPELLSMLGSLKHLLIQGVMTHFTGAMINETHQQRQQLAEVLTAFKNIGIYPHYQHCANSGAILQTQSTYHETALQENLVRPGLMLYGIDPSTPANPSLHQVATWHSKPVAVRDFPAATNISYGGTFTTTRKSKIAVLPVGYGDGYLRCFSNRSQVLVGGQRAPVVGTVCMDMLMVDVTDITTTKVTPQTPITLMGKNTSVDGLYQDEISPHELATLAQTIPYEIICGIGSRVKREYLASEYDYKVSLPS